MARFRFLALGILLFGGMMGAVTQGCDTFSSEDRDQLLNNTTVRGTLPPSDINVTIDVTHLEAAQTQFTAYLSVELSYTDKNLKFSDEKCQILGDESLKEKMWTPNMVLRDQNKTTIISVDTKNVLISINNTGFVTYTYKMVTTFDCWMDLQKFPFDCQKCNLTFSYLSYNFENVNLTWHPDHRTVWKNVHLSDFVLDGTINFPPTETPNQLVLQFSFHRDIGYYILDFYIPSYLLVLTAWVTFWLQADAGPPRATLGSSTIVAFITLHLGVSKDIPKVPYVKASDIWFLGVICFIFLSLAEFAFVNVIWRRKKQVELKKPHPKYILKGAVMPKRARQELRRYESTQSLSIISQSTDSVNSSKPLQNGNYKRQDSEGTLSNGQSVISIPEDDNQVFSWTTMTPQEVAIYVDRKARIVFPIAFFIFNVLYWVFVTCL